MNRLLVRSVALIAVVLLFGATRADADTIVLRSGNGLVGSPDALINMLVGPADSAFAAALTPADFAAARTGPDAQIIANNPAWISTLPSDPLAKWIGTNATAASAGSTALYAIDFFIGSPFSSASLDLRYAVDNQLGGGLNQGVFFNGMPISGDSTGGTFTSEFSIVRNDIAPLLNVGLNTLYINATDLGGPAGLIFSATITTVPVTTAIPEPSALVLTGMGLLGVYRKAKRNRRA